MKNLNFFLIFTLLMLFNSCSDDESSKNELNKNSISLVYQGKNIHFRELNVVNIIDNDHNIIGKYFESRKSNLDSDEELYRISFSFMFTDSSHNNLNFHEADFTAFKLANNGTTLQGLGYHYIFDDREFKIFDLKYNSVKLEGKFQGYLYHSPIPEDTIKFPPVHLENGNFKVDLS